MGIRVGTSGWVYNHWRGLFYPDELRQRDWFEYYAKVFDTVEINNSFYRLPSVAAFAAWRKQAPPDFVYAVKASRFLTHMKKLRDPHEPLRRFFERASPGQHTRPLPASAALAGQSVAVRDISERTAAGIQPRG